MKQFAASLTFAEIATAVNFFDEVTACLTIFVRPLCTFLLLILRLPCTARLGKPPLFGVKIPISTVVDLVRVPDLPQISRPRGFAFGLLFPDQELEILFSLRGRGQYLIDEILNFVRRYVLD